MRAFTIGLAATAAVLLSCNAIAAAAAWHLETLPDSAPLYKQSGCMGSYGLKGKGATEAIFLDDGADTDGKANLKIGGKIFSLALVKSPVNGKAGGDSSGAGARFDRTFKDKAGLVTAAASLKMTKENPESDSVEEAGTLSVTYMGTTQTVAIEGGTAC